MTKLIAHLSGGETDKQKSWESKIGTLGVREILVEDFRTPIPLVISETMGGSTARRKRDSLDEQARGEDLVSPEKPRFRFAYGPLPEHVGTSASQ